MALSLRRVHARGFRSLDQVDVKFAPLSVLVGPNGSGKSNLLKVLSFVRDTARFDISQAVDLAGGFDRVLRQDGDTTELKLVIEGEITEHSSANALDSYSLTLERVGDALERTELFKYKRVPGRGRRWEMSASGQEMQLFEYETRQSEGERRAAITLASSKVTALGAMSRVTDESIGEGPKTFFDFLSDIRYLDPNVRQARQPHRITQTKLADDASNLAAALYTLHSDAPEAFESLISDMRQCLPGLRDIRIDPVGGVTTSIVVRLDEAGLAQPVDLIDASFGTVRLLALLTALHDPTPPRLTVVEEIDHGLHPYALDVLVDRMRESSQRTQIIVASHSPTLVNRLHPEEIIICDRDPETGESLIPAISPQEIAERIDTTNWQAGELWFSGALGGVPQP